MCMFCVCCDAFLHYLSRSMCFNPHHSCQASNDHTQMRICPWFGWKPPSSLWMVSNVAAHPMRLLTRRSEFSERNEWMTMCRRPRKKGERHLQRQRPQLRLRVHKKKFFFHGYCLVWQIAGSVLFVGISIASWLWRPSTHCVVVDNLLPLEFSVQKNTNRSF
jgi:hypothetical protein